jgi:hypothetical protein
MKSPFMLFIILPLLLLSCSGRNTAVLWSSNKEIVNIVDLYNSSNKEYRIIFQYKENPASAYIKADKKPDILIGEDLQNKEIKSEMINLDTFFKKEIPADDINQALLAGVYLDDNKHLIPLSYSLTTAVFNNNTKRINQDLPTYETHQMMLDAADFNEGQKKRGYSPFWDPSFTYAVLALSGSDFTSSDEKTIQWEEVQLKSGMDFLIEWNQLNGGSELMDFFNTKYLYGNRIQILKDERILFTVMTSSEFLELSDEVSQGLNFLFVSQDFKLNAEDIVYGGISRKTAARAPAADFISWLMKIENQERIVSETLKNKSQSFGFLGGFSSLNSLNCNILTDYYPQLKGKIPSSQYILPEKERPLDFNTIKQELITDWAKKKANGENTTLSEALEKWEKLRIPF